MQSAPEKKKLPSIITSKNDTEKSGGSIVFIESTFSLIKNFDEYRKKLSKSDEYSYKNLIENFKQNLEKVNKDEVSLYMWGSALSSLEEYSEAMEKFKEALNINPDYYEVYSGWADTLFKLERYEEAIDYYEQSDNIMSGDANLYFNWANALYMLGDFHGAEKKFKKALDLTPTNLSCYNNLSASLYKQGKYEKAYEVLLYAQKVNPDNPDIYVSQSNCLVKLAEIKKAKKIIEKALEINPKNPKALLESANLHYMAKEFDDAVIYYKKALQYVDVNPYLLNNIGVSYLKIGSLDTAEEYLKKTIEYTKNNPVYDVYANLANVYIEKNNFKFAIDCIETYAKANNYNIESKERLAKVYTYSGHCLKAVKTYISVLDELNPNIKDAELIETEYGIDIHSIIKLMEECLDYLTNNINSSIDIGEISKAYVKCSEKLYDLGDSEKSLQLLKKADGLAENNPHTILSMGKMLYNQGEKDKGAEYIKKALEKVKPQDINVYKILIDYYITNGNIEESIKTMSVYEEFAEDVFTINYLYGIIYNKAKDYKNAEIKLTKAMRIQPESIEPKIELGKMYLNLNEYDKAIEMLKMVNETNSSAEAYYLLSKAYSYNDKYNLAIQSLKRAVNLNKDNIEYKKELANIYYNNQEYEDAITTLESIVDQISYEDYKMLAIAYMKEKQFDNALQLLKKIPKDSVRGAELFYLMGFTEYKLNNKESAKMSLNKALSIDEEYLDAILILGDLHFDNELFDEALSYYKKALNSNKSMVLESDPKLCKRIAVAGYKNKEYDVAEKYIGKALKLSRVDYELYYYMGMTQIQTGKYEEALENLLTATELKTNFVKGYLELGKLFTIIGSYEEAVAIFKKASEFPKYKAVENQENTIRNKEYWAHALLKLKDYDSAILIFDEILKANPVRTSSLIKYASLLSSMGDSEGAISKFKTVINIEKNNYDACLGIAEEYYKNKNYIQASQYFSICTRLKENDNYSKYYYALSLYQMSSHDEALSLLKKILLIDENNKDALELSGKIYLLQSKHAEALKNFEKLNNLSEENIETLFYVGLSNYLSRNYEKSIQVLKNVLTLGYNDSYTNFIIGMSYYCIDDKENALDFYERSLNVEESIVEANYYIGVIHYELGNYERSVKYLNYTEHLEEYSENTAIYKMSCLLNTGNYGQAEQVITSITHSDTENESLLILSGLICLINDNSDASKYLKALHKINPNSNHLPYYFSLLSRLNNNLSEAEKFLNKEFQSRKDDPDLIYELALLNIEKRDFVEATDLLKLCVEKDYKYFDAYISLGEISKEAQNYNKSKDYFEKALEIKPDNKKALWNIALVNFLLKDYENAYRLFQNTLSKLDKNEEYKALYYIGMCKYNIKDIIVARELFGQSVKSNPKHFDSLYMYGKCCLELSFVDEAYEYFKKASEINPQYYELFIEWAESLIKDKKYDNALEVLVRAKKSDSNKLEPYVMSAEIYEIRNDIERAVSEYEGIVNLNENNFDILVKYAKTLCVVGDYAESINIYNKALKMREPDSDLLLEYAKTLINAENYEEAEQNLLKLLKKTTNTAQAKLWLGVVKSYMAKYYEAIELFTECEKDKQISPQMISRWAFSYYKSGQHKKAIEKYNMLIELSKAVEDDFYYAGLSAMALGQYNIACSYFSEIVMNTSEYFEVYIPFAKALIKSEQTEEAFELLRIAESNNSYSYELYNYWGQILTKQENYKEALEKFDKANSLNSDIAEPHINKAKVYLKLNKDDIAEKEYRKALIIDPNNINCLSGLSDILIRSGQYEEVVGLLKHSLLLDINNYKLMSNLAFAYHKLGQLGYAESYYSNVYDIRPESKEINLGYANLLFELLKYSEAKEKYEYVLKVDKDNTEALFKLGIIHYHLGKTDKAQTMLKTAYEKGERHPAIYKYLGKLDFDAGNYKDSYKNLVKAVEFNNNDAELLEIAGENAYIIDDVERGYSYFEKAFEVNNDYNLIEKWVKYLLQNKDFISSNHVLNRLEENLSEKESASEYPILAKIKGTVLYKLNDAENALSYLLNAYECLKNDNELIYTLANVYIELDMIDDANDLLTPLVEDNLDNIELVVLFSKINRLLGNIEVSLEYSKKIMEKHSSSVIANIEYGECLRSTGDTKKAIVYFENALSKSPTREVIIQVTELYINCGDYKSALDLIKNSIEDYQDDSILYYLYGVVLYNQKRYERALDKFHKSYGLNENNTDVILYIARAYSMVGNYEGAKEFFNIALEKDSEDISIYTEWAEILYEAMNYQEALKIIEKALIFQPEKIEILSIKAKILFEMTLFEEAYSIYSMIEINENSPYDILKNYALCLKSLKMYKEAIRVFSLFELRNEFEQRLYIEYFDVLLKEGMVSRVIQLSKQQKVKDSLDARIKNLIGNAYFEVKDYEEAESYYKYSIKSNLINTEIFFKLAVSQYYLGKYGDAKQMLMRAVNQDSHNYLYYYYLALVNMELDFKADAVDNLKESINYNPQFYKGYCELGRLYFKLELFEEGHKAFESAHQMNKKDIELYKIWSECLININKYELALDKIEIALSQNEKDMELLSLKALVLMKLSNYIDAVAIYDNLLINTPVKANTKRNDWIINLSEALFKLNETNESYKRLEAIKDECEKNINFISLYGRVSLALGYNSIAKKYLKKSIKLNPENVELYMNYGDALFELSQYEQAVEVYKKAVLLDDKPYLRFKLGMCYYHLGDFEDAIWSIETYISFNNDDENALYYYAKSLIKLKQKENAIIVLKKIVNIDPKFEDALYLLSTCYYETGRNRDSIRVFNDNEKYCRGYEFYYAWGNRLQIVGNYEEALEKYKQCEKYERNIQSKFRIGEILLVLDKISESIDIFSNILNENPEDFTANMKYAEALARFGDTEKALKIFEKCYTINPLNYELLIKYGDVLVLKGDHKKAVDIYKEALKLKNNSLSPYIKLGKLYSDMNIMSEAINNFKSAIKIDHNSLEAYIEWGKCLYNQNKYNEAIVKFEKALRIDFTNLETKRLIAKSYFKIKNYSEAEKYYEVLIKSINDNEIVYETALCKRFLKQYNNSIEMFLYLTEDNNYKYEARKNLAELYMKLGKFKQAVNEYNILVSKDQYDLKMLKQYAFALINLDDYVEADNILKKYVDDCSEDEDALYMYGLCAYELKETTRAISVFNDILKLNPQSVPAMEKLSEIMIKMGAYDKALKLLDNLINIDSNNSDAYCKKAEIYHLEGNKAKAINFAEKSIEINKNNANSYKILGKLYLEDKNTEKALINFHKAILLNPKDVLSLYNSALILFKKKDFERSEEKLLTVIDLYENVSKIDSDDLDIVEVHNLLASIYNEWEDYDNALKEFEIVRKLIINERDNESSNLFYIEHMITLIKKYKNQQISDGLIEENNITNPKTIDALSKTNLNDLDKYEELFNTIDSVASKYINSKNQINTNTKDAVRKVKEELRNIEDVYSDVMISNIIEDAINEFNMPEPIITMDNIKIHCNKEKLLMAFNLILNHINPLIKEDSTILITGNKEVYGNEIMIRMLNTNHERRLRDSIYFALAELIFKDIPAVITLQKDNDDYIVNIVFANS